MSETPKPSRPIRPQVLRIPQPLPKRQRASAPAATKRKKFSDVRLVQQTLFDLDQGGAK
jgi:hypothetical protein